MTLGATTPASPTAVVILCGGKGTRARPHTDEVPKPLLRVGDEPILWHLMQTFARQGQTRFVLAGGYLVDQIEAFARTCPTHWSIDVIDTGADTGTGGRIRACLDAAGPRFVATYGDGLGNVDIGALLAFHDAHDGTATVTTVPLPSPYGTIEADDAGRVHGFTEKPTIQDRWINAGFFVFDRDAIASTAGDDLEREVLPDLARRGTLFAYRHRGFWRSMDTYKDVLDLTALCNGEDSPWLLSPESPSS